MEKQQDGETEGMRKTNRRMENTYDLCLNSPIYLYILSTTSSGKSISVWRMESNASKNSYSFTSQRFISLWTKIMEYIYILYNYIYSRYIICVCIYIHIHCFLRFSQLYFRYKGMVLSLHIYFIIYCHITYYVNLAICTPIEQKARAVIIMQKYLHNYISVSVALSLFLHFSNYKSNMSA